MSSSRTNGKRNCQKFGLIVLCENYLRFREIGKTALRNLSQKRAIYVCHGENAANIAEMFLAARLREKTPGLPSDYVSGGASQIVSSQARSVVDAGDQFVDVAWCEKQNEVGVICNANVRHSS
jgi:hypothetical protein